MRFSFDPHLRSDRKCIAQSIIIGQQTEDVGGLLAVLVVFHSDTVTDLLIVLVIGLHQISGNRSTTQLVHHSANRLFRNVRIDPTQALQHHIQQNNLFLVFTSGSVRKCIRLFCHTIQNSIIMPLLQSFDCGLLNHIFCYDFQHRITYLSRIPSFLLWM